MRKPTENDLQRIRIDLKEMLDYFVEINNERDLNNTEDNVNYHLMEALDCVEDALFYIVDLRENIVME